MTYTPSHIAMGTVLDAWHAEVKSGKKPVTYNVGLPRYEFGPGLVNILGGPPAGGKTALATSMVTNLLLNHPQSKAMYANVEMSPGVITDRMIANVGGVSLSAIRSRQLTADQLSKVEGAIAKLATLRDRLTFLQPPFDIDNIVATFNAFRADVMVLDYIQRFVTGSDRRQGMEQMMSNCRSFANDGASVMLISAISRAKDSRGNNSYSPDAFSAASFRESSEIEYGADNAHILGSMGEADENAVLLKNVKSRYSELSDIELVFEKCYQRFTPREVPTGPETTQAILTSEPKPALEVIG